ncbi:MAG: bifunctional DNA-formamidopyrimidine glycosylase/DNA-(apurinic or apyrimidinic site) lyase [Acidobacteria bacterium]|nr:bifunctional DNA-formamidopyrimidine glycosylase/DNA-(apurinic or apyrimidinic site) lyase [Acidobacteriota bacterium]
MPELPEVEAVACKLRAAEPWCRIVGCGQFRPTTMQGGGRAIGQRIVAVDRRGKHLLLRLGNGCFLRVHLKMTGNLTVAQDARMHASTVRAWFALDDGRAIVLDDPRALGRISFHEKGSEDGLFAGLGPEPFDAAFTLDHLVRAAKATKKPIKLLLMEQKAVVGLGNIYAAEALFQAAIHPARPAHRLSRPKLEALYTAIREVLGAAMSSAAMAYERPGEFSEGESFPAAVYGREGAPCLRCAGTVRRMPQGGRSTYYCPKCQK